MFDKQAFKPVFNVKGEILAVWNSFLQASFVDFKFDKNKN